MNFFKPNAMPDTASQQSKVSQWTPGVAPVAVIMISLNEGHNMEAVLENLKGWAQEVFLVDSYSQDATVDIALRHGVHVVQRKFRGFGDQWNFALRELPITAPWSMKLDPDERLSKELKRSLLTLTQEARGDAFSMERWLWFMQHRLPIHQRLIRVWRTGWGQFTDVAVNEHPIVTGVVIQADGVLEHHDSPDLDHWLDKQNRYTTAEALMAYTDASMAAMPRLLGSPFERRMWWKKHFHLVPFRFFLLFLYNFLVLGAWRAGRVGAIWCVLRSDVMRYREYKWLEMRLTGRLPSRRVYGPGQPDPRVPQYE